MLGSVTHVYERLSSMAKLIPLELIQLLAKSCRTDRAVTLDSATRGGVFDMTMAFYLDCVHLYMYACMRARMWSVRKRRHFSLVTILAQGVFLAIASSSCSGLSSGCSGC